MAPRQQGRAIAGDLSRSDIQMQRVDNPACPSVSGDDGMKRDVQRRQFLQTSCGLGLCACAASALTAQERQGQTPAETASPAEPEMPAWRMKWWLEHARKQMALLWTLLPAQVGEAKCAAVLEQLGRNCARSVGWAKQHVGDPDGFFNFLRERLGEQAVYDKDKGIITITTRQRDCDCQLVSSKTMPPIYCACSVGWQKHTYETILGKKVDVQVKESVLKGSKRCVFVVTILDEPVAATDT
jgi:predicted hydrocarbon binding protein